MSFSLKKLFPIEKLLKPFRGSNIQLLITDRYSKLLCTFLLKKITIASSAMAFVTSRVLIYGSPKWLLPDNEKQFTIRFFKHVCKILGVENLFKLFHHPQCNGQTERFNLTVFPTLRHYVSYHSKNWDLYTDVLAYAFNRQVHRATKCIPYELFLWGTPQLLAMAPHLLRKSQNVPRTTCFDGHSELTVCWTVLVIIRATRKKDTNLTSAKASWFRHKQLDQGHFFSFARSTTLLKKRSTR